MRNCGEIEGVLQGAWDRSIPCRLSRGHGACFLARPRPPILPPTLPALRAISLRCAGVSLLRRAFAPALPSSVRSASESCSILRLPKLTAAAFFRAIGKV
jgi:hypothetical protein